MSLPALQWSPDDRQLASGGNDNTLCVWASGSGLSGSGSGGLGGGLGLGSTSGASTGPVLKFTEHQVWFITASAI